MAHKHLMAEPRRYVLALVRAAVRRGAPAVWFYFTPGAMIAQFGGEPFSRRELDGLDDAVLAPKEGALQGLRELGLAVTALRSLSATRIRIFSGDGVTSAGLVLEPGSSDRAEAADRLPAGTRMEVFEPDGEQSVVGDVRVEVRLLERFCRYARIPVFVDGGLVSNASAFSHVTAATVTCEERGLRGVAGFLPQWKVPAELRLLQDEVWIATERLDLDAEGFVACVQVEGLQLDLSQAKVIRDAAYERAVDAAGHLLQEARQSHDVRDESEALLSRYQEVVGRLDSVVQGYAKPSNALITGVSSTVGVGLLAALFVFHFMVAIMAGIAVGVTLRKALRRMARRNIQDRFTTRLLEEFPSASAQLSLAFVAFKARERDDEYRAFRPVLYRALSQGTPVPPSTPAETDSTP